MLQFPKLLLPGLIPCDNYYLMPATSGTGAAPAIQLNYIPIWISTYCKVIEIGFNVTTLSATNKAKVGIYEYDISSDPTTITSRQLNAPLQVTCLSVRQLLLVNSRLFWILSAVNGLGNFCKIA